MTIEEILESKPARLELWRRLVQNGIGMTRITQHTLKSMLFFGDDAAAMMQRFGISHSLATTRRHANGREVLRRLREDPANASLFEGLNDAENESVD